MGHTGHTGHPEKVLLKTVGRYWCICMLPEGVVVSGRAVLVDAKGPGISAVPVNRYLTVNFWTYLPTTTLFVGSAVSVNFFVQT